MKQSTCSENKDLYISPEDIQENRTLKRMFEDVPEGSTITLSEGLFQVNEAIKINKSMSLIGAGKDKTIIKGNQAQILLECDGTVAIKLEGISFQNEYDGSCSAVKITAESLEVASCSFSGGKGGNQDDFGHGLQVSGKTEFAISECFAEQNSQSGLCFIDRSKGSVLNCSCFNNDAGVSADGTSHLEIKGCTCYDNKVGIAYDGESTGLIEGNELYKNSGGILAKSAATPVIKNNKVSQCKGGIGLAEESNCKIEGNTILENEYGVMLAQKSQATISANDIFENDYGVHLKGESGAKILNNHIYYQKYYGIQLNDSSYGQINQNKIDHNLKTGIVILDNSQVDIIDNMVRGNFQLGIHARGNAYGKVSGNTLVNNGIFNLYHDDGSRVDLGDNKDLPGDKVSVNAKLTGDTWCVTPPEAVEKVSFDELLEQAMPGQSIHFTKGVYSFEKPVVIDKPLNLIADEPGKVWLTGASLDYLICYQGEGVLQLSGFLFKPGKFGESNLVEVHSGMLELDRCELIGAQDLNHKKRAKGAGLLLLGKAKARVSNSYFDSDFLGISVLENSFAEVSSNKFEGCGYGVILRDSSTGLVSKNEFNGQEAWSVMAYDNSKVTLKENNAHDNKGGFACMDASTMIAENNTSSDNEVHGYFIDGDTKCTLLRNTSSENKLSGFSFWGNSQSLVSENKSFENNVGFEVCENATVKLLKNKLSNNEIGALIADSSQVTIQECEIVDNESYFDLRDDANLELIDNIFDNNNEYSDEENTPALCFYSRGVSRFEEEDFEGALKDFSKGIKVEPKNLYLYTTRAHLYFRLDENDADGNAMKDVNYSIQLDASNADAYHLRGKILHNQGKYKEALKDLIEAIRLEHDSYDQYLSLAETYGKMDNSEGSISNYQKYIELGGYREDNFEEVLEKINTLQLQLNPTAKPYEFIPPDEEDEEEEDDEDEDEDGSMSFNIGNLFAQMFGSENLSSDPNTAVIPINFLGKSTSDENDAEEYEDDENDEEDEKDE